MKHFPNFHNAIAAKEIHAALRLEISTTKLPWIRFLTYTSRRMNQVAISRARETGYAMRCDSFVDAERR